MTLVSKFPGSLFFLLVLSCISCEELPLGHDSEHLAIPVGRSFLNASSAEVFIADKPHSCDFHFDSCGGYWLYLHKSLLSGGDQVRIRFTRVQEELILYPELAGDKPDWVSPSHYIDSDHADLVARASELTAGLCTRLEKAKAIHHYVCYHVALKIYFDASLDKASETDKLGYGTCMNASRLFVALCRAADVPARTVWGIVNAHDDIGGYNNHHQWAEALDDSGYWHPADFGYTIDFDLNDIRYLDLIYAAEENTVLQNREDHHIIFEDMFYNHGYPTVPDGKIRFTLISDDRPDSMIVEYRYEYMDD
jgi:hypothetical protein